ncbi:MULTISPECIES: flagellar basal body-associated FliL family protein [Phyllobacteriaceae]|jgi:flagellar FliL protein|uniref:Flagellar protein FliL n=1 Tax=Ollibium composti TaxID=2675109 RepID=A0ABY2Q809_9HYPH|nr:MULTISPECIES: flagellar basal body-associated FliL family protein [Mesorhizobium]QDC00541.1 flagellar basal body-associated FliL family protein [Mesorhizobium sp. 8]THF57876.1 flagellar basal body-associated FliL family protein [Mesorhizobium composti]
MANAEQIEAPKGPSLIVQLAMLAAMTVAALGVGWMSGSYLKSSEAPPKPARLDHSAKTEEAPAEEKPVAGAPVLVQLPQITTNLAAPADVWVRMDLSVVYDAPQPPQMTEAIHQDLLAYLRTLKMYQVEGASGYQHLKADLQERAAIRSDGHAKDVLIRTLLFE